MMERTVEELRTLAEDVEKQKNRIVEAVWRAIVGSETPKREDGELIIQGQYSLETRYYFRYKGKDAAILTIKEFMPGRLSYFIQSEEITPRGVMEKLLEIERRGIVNGTDRR